MDHCCEPDAARVRDRNGVGRSPLAPAVAWAQATITGTAKDTSGAVLPGVTVEATSAALIERVRTVVTDATGQYRIVDLQARHLRRDVHAHRLFDRQA